VRNFRGYAHGFEYLGKNRMLKDSKKHNRSISESDWKTIIAFISYKSEVVLLNPENSTRRCSRCEMANALKGAIYECRCGLRVDRQLNAAINLYLQMEGLSPYPKLVNELMRKWSGLTLRGLMKAPMNSRRAQSF